MCLHFKGDCFNGLVVRMRYLGPCGHGDFTPPGVWAACAARGRGPARGLRPLRGPFATPRNTPARLSNAPGFRGQRVFCCGSFLRYAQAISLRAAQLPLTAGLRVETSSFTGNWRIDARRFRVAASLASKTRGTPRRWVILFRQSPTYRAPEPLGMNGCAIEKD